VKEDISQLKAMLKDIAEKEKDDQNTKQSNNKAMNAGASQAGKVEQLSKELSEFKSAVFEHLNKMTTKLDMLMVSDSAGEVQTKLFDDDDEVTESKRYMLDSAPLVINNSDDDDDVN